MTRFLTAAVGCALLAPSSALSAPILTGVPFIVTGISPDTGDTVGGTPITITGFGFGLASDPATIEIATFIDTTAMVVSDTQISGTLPAGEGLGLPVQVTLLAGSSGFGPTTFSYNAPVVLGITPTNGSTQGGYSATITGSNFGTGTPIVSIGGNPAPPSASNHTSIEVTVPAGVGINRPVVVTAAGQPSSGGATFDYDPPSILSINPNTGPQTGGIPIVIQGSNFGASGAGQTVLFGGNPASVVSADHASMTVTLPAAGGLGAVNVSVTVGSQSDTEINGFDYDVVPVELSVFGTE